MTPIKIIIAVLISVFVIQFLIYVINKLNHLIINSIREFFGMFNNMISDIICISLIGLRSLNKFYSTHVLSNSGLCYFIGSFMTQDCLVIDYNEAGIHAILEFISLFAFVLMIGLCRISFINKSILSCSVLLYMIAYVSRHYYSASGKGIVFLFFEALVNLIMHQYSLFFTFLYSMYPSIS